MLAKRNCGTDWSGMRIDFLNIGWMRCFVEERSVDGKERASWSCFGKCEASFSVVPSSGLEALDQHQQLFIFRFFFTTRVMHPRTQLQSLSETPWLNAKMKHRLTDASGLERSGALEIQSACRSLARNINEIKQVMNNLTEQQLYTSITIRNHRSKKQTCLAPQSES